MAGDDQAPSDDWDHSPVDEAAGRTLDTTFELLSNARRRYAVYALLEAPDGVLAFEDLTSSVAEREIVAGDVTDPADHRERVDVDLKRWHLPVLAEAGVVEFDDRSGVVRYAGDPTLERWAERARTAEFE